MRRIAPQSLPRAACTSPPRWCSRFVAGQHIPPGRNRMACSRCGAIATGSSADHSGAGRFDYSPHPNAYGGGVGGSTEGGSSGTGSPASRDGGSRHFGFDDQIAGASVGALGSAVGRPSRLSSGQVASIPCAVAGRSAAYSHHWEAALGIWEANRGMLFGRLWEARQAEMAFCCSLVMACAACDRWAAALALLQHVGAVDPVKRSHRRCRWLAQARAACAATINACSRNGRWELALAVLQEFRSWRARPSRTMYNAALRAVRWPRVHMVPGLLEEMRRDDVVPDFVTYIRLLETVSRSSWPQALHYFHAARAFGETISTQAYSTAVCTLATGTQLHWALEVLETARSQGIQPSGQAISSIVAATLSTASTPSWRKALDMLRQMMRRDIQPGVRLKEQVISLCDGARHTEPLPALFDGLRHRIADGIRRFREELPRYVANLGPVIVAVEVLGNHGCLDASSQAACFRACTTRNLGAAAPWADGLLVAPARSSAMEAGLEDGHVFGARDFEHSRTAVAGWAPAARGSLRSKLRAARVEPALERRSASQVTWGSFAFAGFDQTAHGRGSIAGSGEASLASPAPAAKCATQQALWLMLDGLERARGASLGARCRH